jgi:3-oxoacyl-[acyl-carrier protein] reductase
LESELIIDLSRKVVMVSGGGRGIGRAIVQRFAEEKSEVIALDLAFPEALPAGSHSIICDVTDAMSVREAVAEIVQRFGAPEVLVNNAGINVEGSVETLDPERWKAAFDVNAFGTFLLSQAVVPSMKAAGRGRILTPHPLPRSSQASVRRPMERQKPRSCSSRGCWPESWGPGESR